MVYISRQVNLLLQQEKEEQAKKQKKNKKNKELNTLKPLDMQTENIATIDRMMIEKERERRK